MYSWLCVFAHHLIERCFVESYLINNTFREFKLPNSMRNLISDTVLLQCHECPLIYHTTCIQHIELLNKAFNEGRWGSGSAHTFAHHQRSRSLRSHFVPANILQFYNVSVHSHLLFIHIEENYYIVHMQFTLDGMKTLAGHCWHFSRRWILVPIQNFSFKLCLSNDGLLRGGWRGPSWRGGRGGKRKKEQPFSFTRETNVSLAL